MNRIVPGNDSTLRIVRVQCMYIIHIQIRDDTNYMVFPMLLGLRAREEGRKNVHYWVSQSL